MMNVFSCDPNKLERKVPLFLDLEKYYGWYGCVRFNSIPFEKYEDSDLESIKCKVKNTLNSDEEAFLIDKWQSDYINAVLKKHPKKIKIHQLEKFKQELKKIQ